MDVFYMHFLIFVCCKRFCTFLYLQNLFVKKKKKKFETGLMTSFILLLPMLYRTVKIVIGNFSMFSGTGKIVTWNFLMLYCTVKIVTGNFCMLYCCKNYEKVKRDKKCLIYFWGFVSSFLKCKKFFKLV